MGCCSPQLRGMLRKNWILTKRNPRELLREVLIPIFYLAIMIIVRWALQGSIYPAVPSYSDGGWNSKWWSYENVGLWFFDGRGDVLPDNITVGFAHTNGTCDQFPVMQKFISSFEKPIRYEGKDCFPSSSQPFTNGSISVASELASDDLFLGVDATTTTTLPAPPPPGPNPPLLLFCPQFECYDSPAGLEAAAMRNNSNLFFGVVFSNLPDVEDILTKSSSKAVGDDSVQTISYTIRLNHSMVIGEVSSAETYQLSYSDIASSDYVSATPTNQTKQWEGIFSAVQLAVDDALLDLYGGANSMASTNTTKSTRPFVESSLFVSTMPTPSFVLDISEAILAFLVPAWLSNVFMLQIRGSLQRILEDKQGKIRVGLTMIGLSDTIYWLSWAILIIGKGLIIVVILTLTTHFGNIFPNTNPLILLILFLIFSVVCCAYSFLATAFFSKARLGAIVGYLIFLFSMLGGIALEFVDSVPLKMGLAVWPPIAFYEVLYLTLLADAVGMPGIQFDNILNPDLTTFGVSFGYLVAVLCASIVWLFLLAAYANQVVPNEWGTTKPWNFPCIACCRKPKVRKGWGAQTPGALQEELLEAAADSEQATVSLRIMHLRKVFGTAACCGKRHHSDDDDGNSSHVHRGEALHAARTTKVTAVDDLSLEMQHGQITALLGHNGAGKTTTIGMLTGLLRPTSGDAEIYGHSIVDDLKSVRPLIGVCPQQDVLFDKLTVKEHIQFYANIKGQPVDDQFEAKTRAWLKQLDLLDKSDDRSTNLSGGQKRKLSTIIALLGDRTRLVFLDEPSSGMDPWARRLLWGVLEKAKSDKTIILTTHYMDEADILGDHIAVLSRGKLQVSGPGLSLKSKYGLGYHLIVSVEVASSNQGMPDSHHSKLLSDLDETIFRLVPGSSREHDGHADTASTTEWKAIDGKRVASTVTYTLPLDSTGYFPKLFDRLNEMSTESARSPLVVAEYGLSMATLEEVFLRLGQEQEEADKLEREGESTSEDVNDVSISDPKSGEYVSALKISGAVHPTLGKQLKALLTKRGLSSRRDRKSLFIQIFAPVLLVGISYAFQFISNVDMGSSLDPVPLGIPTLKYEHYEAANYQTSFPVTWEPSGCTNPTMASPLGTTPYDVARSMVNSVDGTQLANYDNMPIVTLVNGSLSGLNSLLDQSLNSPVLSNRPAVGGLAVMCNNYTWYSDLDRQLFMAHLVMNASMLQSIPVSISVMNSIRLTSAITGNPTLASMRNVSDSLPSMAINVTYDPFPLQSATVGVGIFIAAQTQSLYVASGFTIVAGMIASQIVHERELGVKSMQLMMGINRVMYWISFFIFDYVLYLIPAALSLGLLAILNPSAFGGAQLPMIATTAVLYGFAVIMFAYVASFLFSKHTTAQTYTLLLCTLGVTILQGISFALSYPTLNVAQLAQDIFNYVALLFPPYSFATALTNLAYKTQCPPGVPEEACKQFVQSPTSWEVCGAPWAFMGISSVLFFLILIGIEYKHVLASRSRLPTATPYVQDRDVEAGSRLEEEPEEDELSHLITEDEDVLKERRKVRAEDCGKSPIQVLGLRKKYSTGTLAVRELDISIAAGECFGLLGPNGAGKTSTIKIVTGFQPPSKGTCYLHGLDIRTQVAAAQRILGFCPQHDALLPLLTGRECLQFYGACKGIEPKQLDACVDGVLMTLGLQAHGNKLTKQYSGGNKRKLSLAIALLGEPKVVLLDEPSSGMDPMARRNMWNLIQAERRARPEMSMILTTHLMEEADELCSRIGILVGGRLACLGTAQHLKSRYSRGYSLEIKLNDTIPIEELVESTESTNTPVPCHSRLRPLLSSLESIAGRAELVDWHKRLFKYQFTNKANAEDVASNGGAAPQRILSRLFSCIEEHRRDVGIENYSLSQTTLEQVFIGFAEKQNILEREQEEVAKLSK